MLPACSAVLCRRQLFSSHGQPYPIIRAWRCQACVALSAVYLCYRHLKAPSYSAITIAILQRRIICRIPALSAGAIIMAVRGHGAPFLPLRLPVLPVAGAFPAPRPLLPVAPRQLRHLRVDLISAGRIGPGRGGGRSFQPQAGIVTLAGVLVRSGESEVFRCLV